MFWSTAYVFTTTCNAYSEVLHDTVISKPIRRTIPNLWQILSIPYLFPLRSYYEWAFDVIVRGWVIAYHVCLVGSLTTRSFCQLNSYFASWTNKPCSQYSRKIISPWRACTVHATKWVIYHWSVSELSVSDWLCPKMIHKKGGPVISPLL